jgi:hypothetical protein
MATIHIENGRFAIDFEALGADGKKTPFRSFYTRSGKPVATRQPDGRSIAERYGRRYRNVARSSSMQGIYDSRSVGGYLVFIDKLESETRVFINWRTGSSSSYRRIPLGTAAFHTYGPKPRPNISDLVFVGGRFFIAWMSSAPSKEHLVLTSVDPRSATRRDRDIAQDLGLVTLISFAHIGRYGLVVSHRAMIGDEDAKIDVYPVRL